MRISVEVVVLVVDDCEGLTMRLARISRVALMIGVIIVWWQLSWLIRWSRLIIGVMMLSRVKVAGER